MKRGILRRIEALEGRLGVDDPHWQPWGLVCQRPDGSYYDELTGEELNERPDGKTVIVELSEESNNG